MERFHHNHYSRLVVMLGDGAAARPCSVVGFRFGPSADSLYDSLSAAEQSRVIGHRFLEYSGCGVQIDALDGLRACASG